MSSRTKGLVLYLVIAFLVAWIIRDTLLEKHGEGSLAGTLTILVTRPITDEMILPDTPLSTRLISNQISLEGCAGEDKPATFTVYASAAVSDVTVTASKLTGTAGIIPSSAVDIRVVKCWYQDSGYPVGSVGASGQKVLIPELLLKDDKLVKVENNENYLKMTDGTYRWISDPTKGDSFTTPTPSEFSVRDSDTLMPVDLEAGQNKQFWVLVKIPKTVQPGTYTGKISLRDPTTELAQIHLQLEVLPFALSPPILEYDLSYCGESNPAYPNGSISHQFKSEQQMRAEFQNMLDHGIYNIAYGSYGHDLRDWYNLGTVLKIRNAVGMTNRPLYYCFLGNDNYDGGLDWKTTDPMMREDIRQATRDVIDFARQFGVTDVYAFGLDEIYDPVEVSKFKPNFEAVHEAGGKIFISGLDSQVNYFGLLGSTVDILNNTEAPDAQTAAKWHSIGRRVFCYGNPQVGVEMPETYRRNYGLLLWQRDYDGAMDFAYQSGAGGSIWNDFDSIYWKDHVFAYPTINGVIDTIEWEGWREAVTDIRYLSTLLDVIKKSKASGVDSSVAEAWLAELKAADLSTRDLDNVRSQIIDHILALTSSPSVLP